MPRLGLLRCYKAKWYDGILVFHHELVIQTCGANCVAGIDPAKKTVKANRRDNVGIGDLASIYS
jgi:hypothetical protein